jgi:hypothetical protein
VEDRKIIDGAMKRANTPRGARRRRPAR